MFLIRALTEHESHVGLPRAEPNLPYIDVAKLDLTLALRCAYLKAIGTTSRLSWDRDSPRAEMISLRLPAPAMEGE